MMIAQFNAVFTWPLAGLVVVAAGSLAAGMLAVRWAVPRFVGGVVIGLVLGPAVLGNLWPDAYRLAISGEATPELQTAWHEEQQQHQRDRAVLIDSGVTPAAVDELDRAHAERLREIEHRMEAQRSGANDQWRLTLMALGTLTLLVAGFCARPVRTSELWLIGLPAAVSVMVMIGLVAAAAYRLSVGAFELSTVIGLAAGCGAAALPIAPVVRQRLTASDVDRPDTDLPNIVLAAAVMLSAIVWLIAGAAEYRHARWLDPGHAAETWLVPAIAAVVLLALVRPVMKRLTGRIGATGRDALIVGVGAALIVGMQLIPAHGGGLSHAWPAALLIALALGATGEPGFSRRAFDVLAPITAAVVVVRFDVIAHLDWLVLLGVLVLYGDMKALGAMLVVRLLGNRRWWDGLRIGTALAAGGVAPLLAAVMLHEANAIDPTVFAALVLSITVTAALAAPMLRWIDRLDPDEPPSREAR